MVTDRHGIRLVDEHCRGCKYLQHYRGIYWEYIEYCSYYADTGFHRNCPPGEGCTCYKLPDDTPREASYKALLTKQYGLVKERRRHVKGAD